MWSVFFRSIQKTNCHVDEETTSRMTSSQILAKTLLAKIRENAASTSIIEAIYAVRTMFPPRKNINKFLAGGAVEECLSELIRSCGYSCANVSSTETVIDIVVKDADEQFPFSLKSIRKLGSAVILENYRGQKREVKELCPTIVAVIGDSQLTLAYIDNDLVAKSGISLDDVYTHADSHLSMKGKFVKTMIAKTLPPEFVIHLPVPDIPVLPEEDISVLVVARVREAIAAKRQSK